MTTPSIDIPERLFEVPVYLPYLQPTLTPRAIEKAEAQLGVKLPAAYLAALRVQNGGYLRLSDHPSRLAPFDWLAGIGPRFPSILEHDWEELKAFMRENKIKKPRRLDDLVSFCGDGHYHYCFDDRKRGRESEPCITYIDVECFDVDKVLAPDFLTFLHELRAEQEPAYGISTSQPIEAVAAALADASGCPLEDQGDQSYGYRAFYFDLPVADDKQGAWLTPNRVKRGFVRQEDPEYAKLAARMTGVALRYPEHADCDYFISTKVDTEAWRGFTRALSSLPYESRAIVLE
ncbi:SMI1/KNR4 family protein [Polyangium sp. 15x6]|uniref:SMI1/KNR4 family protein n=1 Tax=Polyangium sp. 15x6 TaxID=3042687 RepID=UPI00249A8796|nr:SMI1/KNR4 family protein [Polyangium sp. 15x6]MDI3289189.1 SMI1/KNR4 family protein [Polyangium sp. 15x6]